MSSKRTKVVDISAGKASLTRKSQSKIDVNASLRPSSPALELAELQDAVQRIAMYGTFREAKHSAIDRDYRGITQDDILAMLEGKWVLAAKPDWDAEHRNWEYLVEGVDIEGEPLKLKIVVDVERQHIAIITKF